jgi:ATP-dependent helicase HrpB
VALQPLPVDPYLDDIVSTVRARRAAVITALPGAGKTTRVAPALTVDGPVILLQPRRVAARAIARRIADERGWTIGEEVGWQVRFERKFSPRTRLLVVTEGILTARLQQDPLLSGFRTIVLDEFHERSIHADLGLALARQAWLARDDLRVVVMSATLDTGPVAAFLDGCPVIDIPGRVHPLEVSYAAGESVADAVVQTLGATGGQVLCFLPGAPEIRRAQAEVERRVTNRKVEVVPLHGSLDAAEQDDAIRYTETRRVILATNIAETSLTVPGVSAVIDTGLHKVARYDPDRGIDSLETERITLDSADQRAGRAGRVGPGVVRRLWDARDRLRPHREPEIERVDLAAAVLDLIAWGADPRAFEWFEAPPGEAVEAAIALLERLGAIETGRLPPPRSALWRASPEQSEGGKPAPTEAGRPRSAPTTVTLAATGEQLCRFPLHPRLGRILIAAHGAREAAAACALLSERHYWSPRGDHGPTKAGPYDGRRAPANAGPRTTSSDLLSAIDDWRALPEHIKGVAEEIERIAARVLGDAKHAHVGDTAFRKAVLAGYPDRVARRRAPGLPRVVLASGHGGVVSDASGVRDGEFLVAVDVQAGRRGEGSEARIRVANTIEREWLGPTRTSIEHRFDKSSGRVRGWQIDWYDELPLGERSVGPHPDVAAAMLAERYLARGLTEADTRLLRRVSFAGRHVEPAELVRRAAAGARTLDDVDLGAHLPPDLRRDLDRLAPDRITVPSGRHARLDYNEDGSVSASVKLQELFGLSETPRVGPKREPVVLALLAPNGRPVQVTRDLPSFWDRVYPEVRKELRGRYPKHPWPENPWTAAPTARTKKRRTRDQ